MAQLKSTTICGNVSVYNNAYISGQTYTDYINSVTGQITEVSGTKADFTQLTVTDIKYSNVSYTDLTMITFKAGNNDGAGIVIGGGGYTGIGGGESANTVYTALTTGSDSTIGTLKADSEYLVLSGDSGVLMYTNTSSNAFSTNYRIKFNSGGMDAVGSVKALDYTISNKAKITYDSNTKSINFSFI